MTKFPLQTTQRELIVSQHVQYGNDCNGVVHDTWCCPVLKDPYNTLHTALCSFVNLWPNLDYLLPHYVTYSVISSIKQFLLQYRMLQSVSYRKLVDKVMFTMTKFISLSFSWNVEALYFSARGALFITVVIATLVLFYLNKQSNTVRATKRDTSLL